MQPDAVAGGDDLGGQRRVAGDLLADEEEGGAHAARGQHVEHGRCPLAVGAVVEREPVAAPAQGSVGDPERRAEQRQRAGERRKRVRAGCDPARQRERAEQAAAAIIARHVMVSLLIGVALAAGASTLYSLGIAIQALDARDASQRHALRITLLAHLVTRGRWLFGTGMTVLGWPLQILALAYAPLVVVQPALASGLLVLLLVGERLLGETPGRRELTSVAAIVAGVAGIAALAPAHTTHHVHGVAIYIVLGLLGAAAFTPFVLQLAGRAIASVTMIGAGLGFAWSGLVNQFVADAGDNGHWGTALAWAAGAAAAAVVGLTCEMSALQRRPAILVAPVVFVVQTLIPILLAPLVVHASFLDSPLSGVPLLGCLVVLLIGATVIARSPALLALSGARDHAAAARPRRPTRSGRERGQRQPDEPVGRERVREPVEHAVGGGRAGHGDDDDVAPAEAAGRRRRARVERHRAAHGGAARGAGEQQLADGLAGGSR